MTRLHLGLLAILLIAATGCSSIRGERIETGFGPSSDRLVDIAGRDVSPPEITSTASSPQAQSAPQLVAVDHEGDPNIEAVVVSGEHPHEPVPLGLGQGDATASFDFQARELYSGSAVEGTDLFGQGEVLVTFVQPGCDISVDGGATIAETAQEHPEAIFVIVHSGADDEAYQTFAEEAMLFQENMVHLSDTHGSIAKRYNIEAYPTTLLIDANMRITAVTGAMDQEAHLEAVTAVTMAVTPT